MGCELAILTKNMFISMPENSSVTLERNIPLLFVLSQKISLDIGILECHAKGSLHR